ncbi:MAG TPA: response regulator [Gemmatimonadales bacterium]|jgi:DNA-binding response OmpR family regulator|nr:response regulator [Gemmatimonadales bacterium]
MPRPKRVLIVEDDQDMVRFLAAIVEAEGFEALAVGDAFSGITEAVRERPALIITDMQMPAGGGSVLLQRLRGNARTSRIPIMVVTGTVDPSHEDELRQSGAARVLFKPIDPKRFAEELRLLAGTGPAKPQA